MCLTSLCVGVRSGFRGSTVAMATSATPLPAEMEAAVLRSLRASCVTAQLDSQVREKGPSQFSVIMLFSCRFQLLQKNNVHLNTYECFLGSTCEDVWTKAPGTTFVESNIESTESGITETTLYIIVGKFKNKK